MAGAMSMSVGAGAPIDGGGGTKPKRYPPVVRVGIDLGQRHDYTAVALLEPKGLVYQCHQLYRMELGTAYPMVARRIVRIVRWIRRRGMEAEVRLDATGVGRPVLDLVRETLEHAGLGDVLVIGCSFVHGDKLTGWGSAEVSVGKAYLVAALQAALQTGRLRLAGSVQGREMIIEEVLDFDVRIADDGKDTYGAFRTGSHDDLVCALGLALIGPTSEADRIPIGVSHSTTPAWERRREQEQEREQRAREREALRVQLRALAGDHADDDEEDDETEEERQEKGAANAPRRPDGLRGVPGFGERDVIAGRVVAAYDATGNIIGWETEEEAAARREQEAALAKSLRQLLPDGGLWRGGW